MNISQLANDNLSLILNCLHLPYHRLLELRSVSVQFNEVITSMLRSRKSFKLFGSTYSFLWQYSALVRLQQENITGGRNIDTHMLQDVIRWKGLKLSDAEQMLPILFPNIETIFICNINNNQFPPHKLLLKWPNKLRTVVIWGDPVSPEDWVDMWVSMHSQHDSLSHLGLMNFSNIDIPEDCQIMTNISQLSVKGYHSSELQYLLLRIGPKCHTLNLETVKLNDVTLNTLVLANKCLFITSLTIIDLDNCTKKKVKNWLEIICNNFVNLTYFHPRFVCEHLQIDEIHAEISKLPKLTSLRLCLTLDILDVGINANYPWLSPSKKKIFPAHTLSKCTLTHLTLENFWFQKFVKQNTIQLSLFEVLETLFPALTHLKIWSSESTRSVLTDDLVKKLKTKAFKCLKNLEKFELQVGEPLEPVKKNLTSRWHPTLEYSSEEDGEFDDDGDDEEEGDDDEEGDLEM